MSKDILQDGDPFDDPLWKVAHKTLRKPRRRKQNGAFIGCPIGWFRKVWPLCRSAEQLAVALYLYRLRVVRRHRTIKVSNRELEQDLGISRFTKYRTLMKLEEGGVLRIVQRAGQTITITLLG